MSEFRPLPPRPSLEFERKEAKALLRQLRAGKPDAMVRAIARHPAIEATPPAKMKLADAQLVIAREYGFASWPRMVQYFGRMDRQLKRTPSGMNSPVMPAESLPGFARGLMAEHRQRRLSAARTLAAYVPRFFGMRIGEVLDANVTEDDARLALARRHGTASWEELLARSAAFAGRHRDQWDESPIRRAWNAMDLADLKVLRAVTEAHPALLHPTEFELSVREDLLSTALRVERNRGREAMRPIIEWLELQGFDVQRELNIELCGHMYMKSEEVRYLLDRGADPDWIAPNGYSVLEHAIFRYWNGDAVDVLAARTKPRKAFWISAGLGDVDGVRRFLDRDGKPTPATRLARPDFDSLGSLGLPSVPEAEDIDVLTEAFMVAFLNRRTAVLEYLISRGYPINTLEWDMPFLVMAVGNGVTDVVECLIHCGADLDLQGAYNGSAREMARDMLENSPSGKDQRRIAELCGLDPDAVLAELDARPLPTPNMDRRLLEALDLASDDARRQGAPAVSAENLLFGLLRQGQALTLFTRVSGMDFERFRADMTSRVRPVQDSTNGPPLTLNSDAQALVDHAIAIATRRRRQTVRGDHLLGALLRQENGIAADLLSRYGSSAEKLLKEMERSL